MPQIAILSSSIRIGRNSNRLALYLKNFLEENKLATVEILDLEEYNFPLFTERLRLQTKPSSATLDFANKIKSADGILIVTPEYNGGYPASLKNAIDLLYDEWYRKPISIATVSSGAFGGSQVIMQLQFTLWKMRAWMVPATFPVAKVEEAFDEKGNATSKESTDKRASGFINELLWCIEAKQKMIAT